MNNNSPTINQQNINNNLISNPQTIRNVLPSFREPRHVQSNYFDRDPSMSSRVSNSELKEISAI